MKSITDRLNRLGSRHYMFNGPGLTVKRHTIMDKRRAFAKISQPSVLRDATMDPTERERQGQGDQSLLSAQRHAEGRILNLKGSQILPCRYASHCTKKRKFNVRNCVKNLPESNSSLVKTLLPIVLLLRKRNRDWKGGPAASIASE